MSFDRILREISAERAYKHIQHITTEIPSRLAGSASSRRMAEYAYATFQQAGLEARMHEFLAVGAHQHLIARFFDVGHQDRLLVIARDVDADRPRCSGGTGTSAE